MSKETIGQVAFIERINYKKNPQSMLAEARDNLEPLREVIIFSTALIVWGNNLKEITLGLRMLRFATQEEENITSNSQYE